MSNGEKIRLGDVCEIVSGATPKTKNSEYWEGDIKWVTPAELGEDSHYICDTEKHLTEKGFSSASLHMMPKGTVLLTTRAPIGKVAITTDVMCCNQGFKNLVCSEKVYNEYLYRYLRSRTAELQAMGRGATFKELSKKNVSEYEISLPPLPVQREAVEKLFAVEKQVYCTEQQIAQLDQLVKSRFVEMFGELLSETNLATAMRLQDCAEIASGITKGRKVSDGADMITVPYMAVSNVKSGYIDYGTVKSIEVTADELERYRLEPNDVLMTEGGDPDKLGRGAVITAPPSNCIHQNHVFRVRLNREIVRPLYLEMYLQSNTARDYFLHCAKRTTGIATINKRQISNLPVVTPTSEQQDEFIAFAAQVDKTRAIAWQQVDKLQTLYDSLAQDYFA